MQTELEAKFLDVDPADLRTRLAAAGAQQQYAERLMRRNVFDFPDNRLEKVGGWVRVRHEGDSITLTYKQLVDRSLEGTKEVTVTVDSLDGACSLLRCIGLEQKSYQETKREKWLLRGCEVTIDTWPWIPTFCEVEGPDEGTLRAVCAELGFDWTQAQHGSVETAYQRYFDFTEAEIDHWPEITFVPEPDWLEARRIARTS